MVVDIHFPIWTHSPLEVSAEVSGFLAPSAVLQFPLISNRSFGLFLDRQEASSLFSFPVSGTEYCGAVTEGATAVSCQTPGRREFLQERSTVISPSARFERYAKLRERQNSYQLESLTADLMPFMQRIQRTCQRESFPLCVTIESIRYLRSGTKVVIILGKIREFCVR